MPAIIKRTVQCFGNIDVSATEETRRAQEPHVFKKNSQEAQFLGEVKPSLKLGHSLQFHYRTCKFLNSRSLPPAVPSISRCPWQGWHPLSASPPHFISTERFLGRAVSPSLRPLSLPLAATGKAVAGGACPCPPAVAEDHCAAWAEVIPAGFTEPQAALLGAQIPLQMELIAYSVGPFIPHFPGHGASVLVGAPGVQLCISGRGLCKVVCRSRASAGPDTLTRGLTDTVPPTLR